MAIDYLKTWEDCISSYFNLCVCGVKVLTEDLKYMEPLIMGDISSKKKIKELHEIFEAHDYERFEEFCSKQMQHVTGIYHKYLNSKTVKQGDELYNPILNMYWDEKRQMWKRIDILGNLYFYQMVS